MSYRVTARKGELIGNDELSLRKARDILGTIGIDTDGIEKNEKRFRMEVYPSLPFSYDEAIFQPVADLVSPGSYISFLSEEDDAFTLSFGNGMIEDKGGEILWGHRKNEGRIIIPLGDGYSIVAERNHDPDYNELFVFLQAPDGLVHQDLAIIGEKYSYGDEGTVPLHGQYSVKVYGDPETEDWTAGFDFGRHIYDE